MWSLLGIATTHESYQGNSGKQITLPHSLPISIFPASASHWSIYNSKTEKSTVDVVHAQYPFRKYREQTNIQHNEDNFFIWFFLFAWNSWKKIHALKGTSICVLRIMMVSVASERLNLMLDYILKNKFIYLHWNSLCLWTLLYIFKWEIFKWEYCGYLILDLSINDQKYSFIVHSFIIVYQIDPQLKFLQFCLVISV